MCIYSKSEMDVALAEKDRVIAKTIQFGLEHTDQKNKQIAALTEKLEFYRNNRTVQKLNALTAENKRLREALKEILNLSHGEGIHIEGQIAQAAIAEKDREHAKDITVLIKQLQIAGKQITTLKANAEFLSSELERLRSRVVLTPAESHLTMPAALEEGEEG